MSAPAFRRPFLLEEGESLLVASDPVRSLANHVGAANAIGVRQADLIASRMSPVPFPVEGLRRNGRRIDGVSASMMWLPLLWLPERLISRAEFQFVDGEILVVDRHGHFAGDPHAIEEPIAGYPVSTETTDLWVIRVALELEAAGAYDPESGTWLDVLDTVGINIDEIDDVRRVRRWLNGQSDADLDDLNENFMAASEDSNGVESPSWALRGALSTYHDLLNATWALGTDSMLTVVSDMALGVTDGEITEIQEAKFVANMICMLSGPLLRWYSDDEMDWWSEMSATVSEFVGTPGDLVAGPLTNIDERLASVRDHTWPLMKSASAKYEDS